MVFSFESSFNSPKTSGLVVLVLSLFNYESWQFRYLYKTSKWICLIKLVMRWRSMSLTRRQHNPVSCPFIDVATCFSFGRNGRRWRRKNTAMIRSRYTGEKGTINMQNLCGRGLVYSIPTCEMWKYENTACLYSPKVCFTFKEVIKRCSKFLAQATKSLMLFLRC